MISYFRKEITHLTHTGKSTLLKSQSVKIILATDWLISNKDNFQTIIINNFKSTGIHISSIWSNVLEL